MKIRLFLASFLALELLVGCSKDPLKPKVGEPDAPGVAQVDSCKHEHDRGRGHGKH